jgi:hypothetical protein
MEWFKVVKVEIETGERDKLESTSAQEAERVCKRTHAKTAKEYHVLKRCRHFQTAKLVKLIAVRYIERANPPGKVGRPGKRSTDSFACAECFDFYVAIENTLRARTANFIEQAYGEEVCFIDII